MEMDSEVARYNSVFLLLNVCLLLGCCNPFTLTASPLCWLAIWTLWIWKTAEWRGLKKRVLFLNVPGALLSVWLSVGQTLNSSNSVSSGCKEPARGSLGWASILQRGKGALAETLLCKAKTGMLLSFGRKNIFWTFLTLRTVSRYYRKAVTDHCAMFVGLMTIQLRDEALTFLDVLFPGRILGRQLTEPCDLGQPATGWVNFYSICVLMPQETYVSVGTNPCPYQVYIIFPSVIMTSHFEDPCVLSIEERRQAASPVWQGYHHFSPTPEGLCKWFLLCSLSLPDSVGNGRLPSPCDVSSY